MYIVNQDVAYRMTPQQKAHYIGHVIDTNNIYYFFEESEKRDYEALSKEIAEKGRHEVDFAKYEGPTQANTNEPVPEGEEFLKFLPGQEQNEKVLKILKKIEQPKATLTLKECRVLFLEIFKNYKKAQS